MSLRTLNLMLLLAQGMVQGSVTSTTKRADGKLDVKAIQITEQIFSDRDEAP